MEKTSQDLLGRAKGTLLLGVTRGSTSNMLINDFFERRRAGVGHEPPFMCENTFEYQKETKNCLVLYVNVSSAVFISKKSI